MVNGLESSLFCGFCADFLAITVSIAVSWVKGQQFPASEQHPLRLQELSVSAKKPASLEAQISNPRALALGSMGGEQKPVLPHSGQMTSLFWPPISPVKIWADHIYFKRLLMMQCYFMDKECWSSSRVCLIERIKMPHEWQLVTLVSRIFMCLHNGKAKYIRVSIAPFALSLGAFKVLAKS